MAKNPVTIRIPPGIVRGESRAMVPGRWFDANLIRWQGGVMKPVGGWERLNKTPLLSIMREGHAWLDANNTRYSAYIGDTKVYAETGGAFRDITPVDYTGANTSGGRGYGSGNFGTLDFGMDDEDRGSGGGLGNASPLRFRMANWATQLLFSSSADGRVFVWDPANPTAAPLVAGGVPSLIQDFIVTDEHHLMVFAVAGFPNRVQWSDQGNRTAWDPTNITGQAGFFDLENAGQILCAEKIPGGILVFTTNSVWLGRYIGAPYYYGFVKISEGAAPISPHAVAVGGTKAYWMGKQNFWKYEGGVVAPMQHSLGNDLFESIFRQAAPRRVTAGFNGAYPEITWFYPENQGFGPNDTENNRYCTLNFEEGWWADGYMNRAFFKASPLEMDIPLASDDMGYVYQHEVGYLAEGASRLGMVYAEVSNLGFDDGANNWQVNQAMIDSPLGPDSVEFTFSGRTVRGQDYVQLQKAIPRPDGYVDLSFVARDFGLKIDGIKDGPWALGAFVFNDIVRRGPI